jgi:uncharacterized protein (DUF2062 family)
MEDEEGKWRQFHAYMRQVEEEQEKKQPAPYYNPLTSVVLYTCAMLVGILLAVLIGSERLTQSYMTEVGVTDISQLAEDKGLPFLLLMGLFTQVPVGAALGLTFMYLYLRCMR